MINTNSLGNLNYSFEIPEPPIDVGNIIGSSIKDLRDGSRTQMVEEYEKEVQEAETKFQVDKIKYDHEFSKLSLTAEAARSQIGMQRYTKALAITLLSVAVIGSVALPVIAIATGSLAVSLVALPFLIGIAPTSYFTHVQRKKVSRLKKEIAAPNKLDKPEEKQVAAYNPMHDLDLKSTRLAAVKSFPTKSVLGFVKSGWTNDQIVRYRLLDGYEKAKLSEDVPFYNRCITLIDQYNATNFKTLETKIKFVKEHLNLVGKEHYNL